MALSSIGGGYQIGDGNVNEVKLGTMLAPGASTATTTTCTAAVMTGGAYTFTNASAVGVTTATGAQLDALLVNAKVNSSFDLVIINLGSASGAVTVTAGSGVTLVGSATVAISTSARFTARKTADAAWSLYRMA